MNATSALRRTDPMERSRSHGHLLVVDDNRVDRISLVRSLEQEGHTVCAAEQGRQALELLRHQPFDLVLLDIVMPEVDGYEVLEQMKADPVLRHMPVIIVSAQDELDSVVKCVEMGADDYLAKPFNATLLRARITATLEKKRLRDEVVQQLDFIRNMFGRYVPESVARALVETHGVLAPTQVVATILYTDIEGFTGIAEAIPPTRVVQMLNEYFPAVIDPITRHGGIVNQFQGDAMLVTFNIPLQDSAHADSAVRAALGIQEVLKKRTFAGVSLRTRIGINTGEVIAGNIGSGDRVNYTVHGEAVNLAARLEQLNKERGTLVLVSDATASLLQGTYPLESLGEVEIRGMHSPVRVHKLLV